MRPRRSGSIINISSRSGIVGIPSAAAYASSNVTGAEFNIDGGILAGSSATPNV
jgi:NADP-dependent 3-hydroxy acid dehydrogenase YdfG